MVAGNWPTGLPVEEAVLSAVRLTRLPGPCTYQSTADQSTGRQSTGHQTATPGPGRLVGSVAKFAPFFQIALCTSMAAAWTLVARPVSGELPRSLAGKPY